MLDLNDLDPVYVVVHGAALGPQVLRRWLLAYWCYYHVGTACWAAQHSEDAYWHAMAQAAACKRWPRGSERRHYRGGQAVASVAWLAARGLDALFTDLSTAHDLPAVLAVTSTWRGFGPWIGFKIADMLERLGVQQVDFMDGDVLHLYDSPRDGLEAMAQYHGPVVGDVAAWGLGRLHGVLGWHTAPPRHERTLNIQELETILCKWKSHLGGHYHPGKDVEEVRHALLRFARCGLAQCMLAAGRRAALWYGGPTDLSSR